MKFTKTIIALLAIVAGFYLIYYFVDEHFLAGQVLPVPLTNNPAGPKNAPAFRAHDLQGNLVELSQFADKVVIVNFWASWCPPCVKEFPSLIRLVNQFNGQVILLAVSDDENLEAAKNFITGHLLDSPHMKVLWDKDFGPTKLFQVNKLPETFIFKKGGVFSKKVSGFQNWESKETLEYFNSLLKGTD